MPTVPAPPRHVDEASHVLGQSKSFAGACRDEVSLQRRANGCSKPWSGATEVSHGVLESLIAHQHTELLLSDGEFCRHGNHGPASGSRVTDTDVIGLDWTRKEGVAERLENMPACCKNPS